MSREVLPNRREAETFAFSYALDVGQTPFRFIATVGRYPDGRIAEVFLNAVKNGTPVDHSVRDAATVVSLALQHGTSLDTVRHAMGRRPNGEAMSPIGACLDILANP